MIYVLSYPEFEPQVADKIDRFRAIHEPERAKLVRPHVTLVFGVSPDHKTQLETLCAAVARESSAFPISFKRHERRYDPFEEKHKIFLICGDGAKTVTAFHRQLYDGPHKAELSRDHPYEPHMTVATNKDVADINGSDLADIEEEFPINGTIRAIDLVELSNGVLTTLKRYALKA